MFSDDTYSKYTNLEQYEDLSSPLFFDKIFNSAGRSRLIRLLIIYGELNVTKLVSLSHLNHNAVLSHLNFFKRIDFVEEKSFGRIRIFRFREENLKARALKNLIRYWEDL